MVSLGLGAFLLRWDTPNLSLYDSDTRRSAVLLFQPAVVSARQSSASHVEEILCAIQRTAQPLIIKVLAVITGDLFGTGISRTKHRFTSRSEARRTLFPADSISRNRRGWPTETGRGAGRNYRLRCDRFRNRRLARSGRSGHPPHHRSRLR